MREATPADHGSIDRLLRDAFGGPGEATLVLRLRAESDMETEAVAEEGGGIVAYAALFRMWAPVGWLGLGPVAVAPARQRAGLGTGLLVPLVRRAVDAGRTIVVLGAVPFYERVGFSQARAVRLDTPYPPEHTLLAGPGADAPAERLVYPEAFG